MDATDDGDAEPDAFDQWPENSRFSHGDLRATDSAEDHLLDAMGGRLAENIDRPEDDTVFLAPVRDFSPGGSSPGDGKDADIESPFAKGSKPAYDEAQPWLLDPFGKGRQQKPIGGSSLELAIDDEKERTDTDEEDFSDKVAPLPIPIEPPTRLELPIRFDRLEDDVQDTPEPPFRPSMRLGPSGHALPESVPGRMRLIVPRDLQKPETEPLSLGRDNDASTAGIPSNEDVFSPPSDPTSALVPDDGLEAPLDLDVAKERRPALPVAPSRLEAGLAAVRRGASGVGGWLVAGWTAYSNSCAALEPRLFRLIKRVGVQARQGGIAAGSALIRTGRQASATMIQSSRQGAAAMKPWMAVSGKTAIAVGKTTSEHIRHGSAKLSEAVRDGAAALARRRTAATDSPAKEQAQTEDEDVKARAGALVSRLRAAMAATPSDNKTEKRDNDAEETSKTASTADAAESIDAALAAGAQASSAQGRWALPGSWLGLPFAAASFAVAAILFFFAALSSIYAQWPARAELVAKLPERNESLARSAALSPDETSDGIQSGASLKGALPPLLEEAEPLSEIVAYIDDRSQVNGGVSASPDAVLLMSLAEDTEGLQQFVKVAKIVGLDQLLQPGQDYTVFAPTDAAFEKLGAEEWARLLDASGHERLLTLLTHHVLQERVTVDSLRGDAGTRPTMAKTVVSIDPGSIVEADLEAENGILHVIDELLAVPDP